MGANFLCKSSGVRWGMVIDEIDTCIIFSRFTPYSMRVYSIVQRRWQSLLILTFCLHSHPSPAFKVKAFFISYEDTLLPGGSSSVEVVPVGNFHDKP